MRLQLFADGSGVPTGGPGGWAFIIIGDGWYEEMSGGVDEATNQTMELQAILEGLSRIPEGKQVEVITDSQCAVRWLTGEYRRRDRKVIRLCAQIEVVVYNRKLDVVYTHIRGHNGNEHNEKADALAGKARKAHVRNKADRE